MSDLDDDLPLDGDEFDDEFALDNLNGLDSEDGAPAEQPDLPTTLKLLQTGQSEGFSAALYYGLSGLTADEVGQLTPVWEALDVERRRALMRRLADLSETNFELDYEPVSFFLGLEDEDPEVREAAINLLWTNETPAFMARLSELAQWDEAAVVRAAALNALGNFIFMGEMGGLPPAAYYQLQDTVVGIYSNETEEVEVRRRALEAIASSSHEIVNEAIDEAYHSDDQRMRISAVFAMGRAYEQRWRDAVLRELRSDDAEMRYEAARASGELELEEAVPYLIALASEDDREIKESAIWALGEIGGDRALAALTALAQEAEEAGDDSLLEAIEDAIGSATLANMGPDLDLDDE